jgi:uncharacterized membrane protein YagU involved in acid resistance
MKQKLTSRKFWLSVAAFLGSIATSIVALKSDNDIVAVIGIVCAMLSAAIYSGCEAYVDSRNKDAQETVKQTINYLIQSEDVNEEVN